MAIKKCASPVVKTANRWLLPVAVDVATVGIKGGGTHGIGHAGIQAQISTQQLVKVGGENLQLSIAAHRRSEGDHKL